VAGLVNNAGFGTAGPFAEQDRARERSVVRLNCEAVVDLCHLFLPRLGAGSFIVNLASTAAFQPVPHLHANDREGVEKLCGYGARPPLSLERLSALPGGRLAYRLKRPLPGGREILVLQPAELLRRLATLVPPPRRHLVRYHGVFAPNAAWRAEIVPRPPQAGAVAGQPAEPELPTAAAPLGPVAPPGPGPGAERSAPVQTRIPWSELLLRVFREDVLQCPCGGRRVVLAFVNDEKVVKKILEHLGLPTTGPPVAPARRNESPEFAIWQDDVPELQQSLR
jgi:hypothetical protein